jgi:hypothetical protein
MITKTFAQDQDFTAITDEELIAVNGGLSHRPFIGALQNLQMADQANRLGLQSIGSHNVATMG